MVVINDCAIGVIMMRSILDGKKYVEYAISLWDKRLQEVVKDWSIEKYKIGCTEGIAQVRLCIATSA